MAVVGAIPIAFATQRWADGQRCESSSSFQREGGKEVTGNSPCVPLILGAHHRLYFCDLVVSRKKLGGGDTYLAITQRWADRQHCGSSSSFQREGGKEVTGHSPSVPLILGTHHRLYFCDLVVSRKKLGGGGTYLAVPHFLILGTHHRLYFCNLVVSGKKLGG